MPFQINPLLLAAGVGISGMTLLSAADETILRQTLTIRRIDPGDAPTLDGDLSDPIWRFAQGVAVPTKQGANFDGAGATTIEIRAVHDGTTAFFLFSWDDPTRSLKHIPLVKKADGWRALHSGYAIADENEFHEDKLSVLLTTGDVTIPGDRTFHAGRKPLDDQPATLSGRGLHYTMGAAIVDVWQWKATSNGAAGVLDDAHFGPPVAASREEIDGARPYRGGFSLDPGASNYMDNVDVSAQHASGISQPKRLPRDWRATWTAMGPVYLDAHISETEGARWAMTETESVPYSPEADAQIPPDAIIPGVIVVGEKHSGDRGDVTFAARWAAGRWVLEVSRKLDTGSRYDIPIRSGVSMRVAAFDHSQIRHTRHVRPIKLEVP